MAVCPKPYLVATGPFQVPTFAVDDSAKPILLVAGTELDIVYGLEAVVDAVFAGFTSSHWSAMISSVSPWVRFTGAGANTDGQYLGTQFMNLTTPAPWKDHLSLTVSGIQGIGQLSIGNYSAFINLDYVA